MSCKKNESQFSELQMVEIDQSKFAIQLTDGNIRVNLTKMALPFRKKPADWLRTIPTKEYIKALSVSHICATADFVQVIQGGKSDEQGTWANDYRIAMRFAQWLSPEFAIKVDEMLVNMLLKRNLNDASETFAEANLPAYINNLQYEFDSRVRTKLINDKVYYKVRDISILIKVLDTTYCMKRLKSRDNFIKLTPDHWNVAEWWCNRVGLQEFLSTKNNKNMIRMHDALFSGQLSLTDGGQQL